MGRRQGEKNLLCQFAQEVAPDIERLASRFWVPPQRVACRIEDRIGDTIFGLGQSRVVVSGETDNLTVYVVRFQDLIIYTPRGHVVRTPIFEQAAPDVLHIFSDQIYLVEKNADIMERLVLPKVLLINPSVKDLFPAPRLALCVSYLASYLRKLQKAEVDILDMQLDLTVEDLTRRITDSHPEIVGISMSFGQMALSERILAKLFQYVSTTTPEPIVVAGNVIAGFGYERLLAEFPDLIICIGEGEKSIAGIVEYKRGRIPLSNVPGIVYRDGEAVVKTACTEVDMDQVPLPAMDTVDGILKSGGAMTIESSRGCSHSRCTFCPRTHKPVRWKGMSSGRVLSHLDYYGRTFDRLGGERRVFFVDEDFLGNDDSRADLRIREIMRGIIDRQLEIQFEADTRIDHIYSLRRNKAWHVERIKTLKLCQEAGLERLLLGVESGSDSVLERFGKGISIRETISALRILTVLGLGLRITFITFDPLMSFRELKENLAFLSRTDIFLRQIQCESANYGRLFDAVHDAEFITAHSLNTPFYERVCYMLVNLEVLMNCEYLERLRKWEFTLDKSLVDDSDLDYNMARYRTSYLDPVIGAIALNCQMWIDRHFAVDYCLKGMYKVAPSRQRERILGFRHQYRKLSFLLLKTLIWLFDTENEIDLNADVSSLHDIIPQLSNLKREAAYRDPNQAITPVLEVMYKKMLDLVSNIENALGRGELLDPNGWLKDTLARWKDSRGWVLINP